MNDVRLSLSYKTPTELKNIGRSLLADPNDIHVPGWFVHVVKNKGYNDIIKIQRVSDVAARSIAIAIDTAVDSSRVYGRRATAAVAEATRERQHRLAELRKIYEEQQTNATAALERINAELGAESEKRTEI